MTSNRARTALGWVGLWRPSVPYVVSILVLVVGLVATQLWPAGLRVAQPEASASGDNALYQAQRPETLPRNGPVIVVLKTAAVSRSSGGPARGAQVVARTVGARPTQVFGAVFPGFAANLPREDIQALSRNPNVAYIMPDLPVRAAAQATPTSLQ
ncbi:MAG: protease inhibitor I9 family protein, partial [Chloroflexota bacterium]|nr:protease inhibitor I9 family protein [Chloroflexota bacterium]